MQDAQNWLRQQGTDTVPEIHFLDVPQAAPVERALLGSLLAHTEALARAASQHAQHVAALRAEVETLTSVRADLDRFIGDVGLAHLACTFSTAEPDYETQIELTPGVPLRQLLPVASTGFAAIDLACAAAPKRHSPLRVALVLIEEGSVLAEWHVPPPDRNGWIRLGLPRAYAGLARSLALIVESASTKAVCGTLGLSGYQPLVAAQVCEAETGLSVGPHALAFRAYAALPGTTPPHDPATLLPLGAQAQPAAPHALRAVPTDVLARAGEDRDEGSQASPTPRVLYLPEVEAVLCCSGAQAVIPDIFPPGSLGLILQATVHAAVPSCLEVELRTEAASRSEAAASEAEQRVQRLMLSTERTDEISILLPHTAAEPQDFRIAVRALDESSTDRTWAVFTKFRVYT
ncbi:DUF6212 domain-containing protein [Methylobacterium nigriterrae]|uniref:DUF6212 domain-containing protein n=1 Tax=Methylobacterium nigriterrae TaxID=3127512 RepID=UPI003013C271